MADDNDGKYPTNKGGSYGLWPGVWMWDSPLITNMYSYLPPKSGATKILLCPVNVADGWPGHLSDLNWKSGGFGAYNATNSVTWSSYCITAGFQSPFGINYMPGEPPWPAKTAEATAQTAIVFHRISGLLTGSGTDWGHHGSYATTPSSNPVSDSQVVGYGDGHVEMHSNSQIKQRIIWLYGSFDWWY